MDNPSPLDGISPVEKPVDFLCLGNVNIEPIRQQLARFPEHYWQAEDAIKENRFKVLSSVQHIILRFIKGNRDPRQYYEQLAWNLWRDTLTPVMQQIADLYGYDNPCFPKVMFAKLDARSGISPHSDGFGSTEYVHKIHVPLTSDPSVMFRVADKAMHLAPGQAYEVNNVKKHAVDNPSPSPRTHLILELFNHPP